MAFCMNFKSLPRCEAKARSNGGLPCRQAAKKNNNRCHWHGGRPAKHGRYTKKAQFERTRRRVAINEMRQALYCLGDLINAATKASEAQSNV